MVAERNIECEGSMIGNDEKEPFAERHIGPREEDVTEMTKLLGYSTLDEFCAAALPAQIQTRAPLELSRFPQPLEEGCALGRLSSIAAQNQVWRSYIGMGYYGCRTPAVIQRNILENPGWYTQYTPYQPEISQGRLEALLNYQTMVSELTALPISNASLLDEGTAAGEAMMMCRSVAMRNPKRRPQVFYAADDCHPQVLAVLETRARGLDVEVQIGRPQDFNFGDDRVFGVLLSYPTTYGEIRDYAELTERAHAGGALVAVATDLLALTLLKAPGEWGADIALGSSQRFGVPLGFGGPHAAFMATRTEYQRLIPGRLIGVSKGASGERALRLALQTREQHIRREKATSNICTAQVLLAIMAGMYAVYHGPEGLWRIARRVNRSARLVGAALERAGARLISRDFFDTVTVELDAARAAAVEKAAGAKQINLRRIDQTRFSIALDETVTDDDLKDLLGIFKAEATIAEPAESIPAPLARTSGYLGHEVFQRYHSETEFLRYVRALELRDLSLATAMIPLGSCTMKLNATSEMLPVSWPEFGGMHPFAPVDQTRGYQTLFRDLGDALRDVSGLAAVSLQPNAGSQGEYTGLMVIRAYHESRGSSGRRVCLIPTSAHGTNPASAAMAGLTVVPVKCDEQGNIDVRDLCEKSEEYRGELAALMVTYPSTHGVFEESIKEICRVIHEAGGQVYMDGANMNALVGLCRPAELGADVIHVNLHKTFCIPHGGGGPGVGPIAVAAHLAEFLPNHPLADLGHASGIGPVSASPYGSPSILPISWMYIAMMGGDGLKRSSQVAILNANYVARKLEQYYPVLYKGKNGMVAHECILDCRAFKKAGIEVDDVAKRLMDYGFHAPTVSWPVAGTIMVEPTESESREELDRFCEAMIAIREEIRAVEEGRADRDDNVLKNAPHTAAAVTADEWKHSYSREQAAFPTEWTRERKFWPTVSRVDSAYGDRNLVCSCS